MSEESNSDLHLEKLIIKSLLFKENVRDKVVPYLSKELFTDLKIKKIIAKILEFNQEFKTFPKPHDLALTMKDDEREFLKGICSIDLNRYNNDNILKQIENQIKKQTVFNLITQYVESGDVDQLDIQKLMEAKSFSFDDSVGLDLLEEDGEEYFKYLHDEEVFVKTGLKQFDYMMDGGIAKKTILLAIGQTNIGKTLFKCALAKQCLINNSNVLFIPLEGTAQKIKDRLIWNLFDLTKAQLKKLGLDEIKQLFAKTKNIIQNRLVIKEYGEHSFNANKLRLLLKELKEKKKFIPDIVFIDYLGLTIPNVLTKDSGNQASSLKRASEEFHAVAKESDFALFSSMQFNRQGYNNSDPDMDNISESFGTLFTADDVILIIQTEEMKKENRYLYKKVKARGPHKGFVGHLCVDFDKQKLFEMDSEMKNEQEKKQVKEILQADQQHIQKMLEKVDENRLKKVFEFD